MSSTYKSVVHVAHTYDAVSPVDAEVRDWISAKSQYHPLYTNRELKGRQETDVVFVGSHYVESSSEIWDSMVETAKEIGESQATTRRKAFILSAIVSTLLFILFFIIEVRIGPALHLLLILPVAFCLKHIFRLVMKFILWADLQIHSVRSAWATRRRYKRLVAQVKRTTGLDEEIQDAVYEAEVRNFLNDRSEDA